MSLEGFQTTAIDNVPFKESASRETLHNLDDVIRRQSNNAIGLQVFYCAPARCGTTEHYLNLNLQFEDNKGTTYSFACEAASTPDRVLKRMLADMEEHCVKNGLFLVVCDFIENRPAWKFSVTGNAESGFALRNKNLQTQSTSVLSPEK
jgi:hypothetical protein